MRIAVALLAVLLALGPAACGEGDAEPGAPREATLVLDFQPNAVHAGIYAALQRGYYEDRGVDLEVREPGASTDAPKLLAAGRTEFAILDIHDLAIARERGFDLVAIAPLVQRPLAAVIARDRKAVRRPPDLAAGTVGVTGLPSDEAVLDSVLAADGVDPGSVERVTIGFRAVQALAAGRLDAATAFWNAEGVALRRLGVRTREFRVDDYGAPSYPELVLVTSAEQLEADRDLAESMTAATARGYEALLDRPGGALDDLLSAAGGLARDEQRAQLDALLRAGAFEPVGTFDGAALERWARWDARHGIVREPPDVEATFESP